MPVNKIPMVSRDDQFSMISVFDFENENMRGVFHNGAYGDDRVFMNLVSLILILEDCMNQISFPQPMVNYRKLTGTAESVHRRTASYRDSADNEIPQAEMPQDWNGMKPLCTFKVRIVFRTISGWQGEVLCQESERSLRFKSDLEFILFMADELRKTCNGSEENKKFL